MSCVSVPFTGVDSESVHDQLSVTFELFQPSAFFAGLCPTNEMPGFVLSSLKFELVVGPPVLPATSVQLSESTVTGSPSVVISLSWVRPPTTGSGKAD